MGMELCRTLNIPKEPIPEAQTRTAFMAGNWKMNPTTIREALALAALLATTARNLARDKPDLDVEVRSALCQNLSLTTMVVFMFDSTDDTDLFKTKC